MVADKQPEEGCESVHNTKNHVNDSVNKQNILDCRQLKITPPDELYMFRFILQMSFSHPMMLTLGLTFENGSIGTFRMGVRAPRTGPVSLPGRAASPRALSTQQQAPESHAAGPWGPVYPI